MPGRDTNIGAKRARDARARVGLPAEAPLACLLTVVEERFDLPVVLLPIADGYAGAYLRRGTAGLVVVHQPDGIARKRFTLAHELGHHVMGHPAQVDTWADMLSGDRPPHELQANAFAAEFVAPAAGIRAWFDEHAPAAVTLETIAMLSARFGLSCEATMYRLTTLRLLTDAERAGRVAAEIEAGDHHALIKLLGLDYPDDELAGSHDLSLRVPPDCSPAAAEIAALPDLGSAA